MQFQNFKPSKSTIVFALIIIALLAKDYVGNRTFGSSVESYPMMQGGVALSKSASFSTDSMMAPAPNDIPISNAENRKVVHNTDLSLQVKSVTDTAKSISDAVANAGGFIINSSISRPGEVASGNLSFRIPNDKAETVLNEVKGQAIKVVSETTSGYDVTDQYEDTAARLETLMSTKARLEKMHTDAASVSELLQVQQELTNLQMQIDSLKGREQYLTQVSKLTLVTVYLSTDDLALPYAPDTTYRPEVVFKQAVRSLVVNLRSLGNSLIWLVVYSPLWGAALIGLLVWKKKSQRSNT